MVKKMMEYCRFKVIKIVYLNEFVYNKIGKIIGLLFPRLRGDILAIGIKS